MQDIVIPIKNVIFEIAVHDAQIYVLCMTTHRALRYDLLCRMSTNNPLCQRPHNPVRRTVLITGAAQRIGRVIARTLATAGWSVGVHAHSSHEAAEVFCAELQSEGYCAWSVTGDLLAKNGAETLFNAAVASGGPLDALVNNAAQFTRQPLMETSAADFEQHWQLNALAPIQLTQCLAQHLRARQQTGCVINLLDQRIASPCKGAIPYLLSKKALEAFTLSAALELAPLLRVNAVAPGAVLPPTDPRGHEPAGRIPLNCLPAAEHIAEAVNYLLQATSVTGQILFVDGGQHLTCESL